MQAAAFLFPWGSAPLDTPNLPALACEGRRSLGCQSTNVAVEVSGEDPMQDLQRLPV